MTPNKALLWLSLTGGWPVLPIQAQPSQPPHHHVVWDAPVGSTAIDRPPIIWRKGPITLHRARQDTFAASPADPLYLSIIRAPTFTGWIPKLQQEPQALTVIRDQQAFDIAVMRLDSVDQLNQLARRAHALNGFCGSIETIPLTHSLVDLTSQDLTPPVYHSRATFADLEPLLEQISTANMSDSIAQLTALETRFHSSTQATTAVDTVVSLFTEAAGNRSDISIETVAHDITPQDSVIVRISGDSLANETVVLGAHLDTISPERSLAPGADDDATGIASMVEILRLITTQDLTFERTIELHAYGAEEVGLIGSREIAVDYRERDQAVAGMMQIDMNAWGQPDDLGTVYLVENETSLEFRRRATDWLAGYITSDFATRSLPFNATSDHKSWYDQGYPTLFAFENPEDYNPNIHTTQDTQDTLNNQLLSQRITQLAMVYLAYTGGLKRLQTAYDEQKTTLFTTTADSESLRLAITEQQDGYSLAVSTSTATTSLEICRIQEQTAAGCLRERRALSQSTPQGQRNIFYIDAGLDLAPQQKWRIEAFNDQNELLEFRQVAIEASTSTQ